ncbi:MAG: hypothetical protein QOF61_1078 [Acidobacteriota bacterium]|jgi:hypothetical protein|nr:hypothetical protein [Acidobacteriota bacterium]
MNAAGLVFTLNGVSTMLNSVFYDNLEGVSAEELAGTRSDMTDLAQTVQNTPGDKIEAMVDQYNPELTQALNAFDGDWAGNRLQGFRDAQVMMGFVSTLMAKSGLSD